MNNEPVAWMRLTGDRVTRITLEKVQDSDIPLYTHPVKQLTDEEIMEVVEQIECTYSPIEIETSYDYEVRLAKAILKKAQEK